MRMVAQRELLVVSRRGATYWGRFAAALIGIFLLWHYMTEGSSGQELFSAVAVLGIGLCVVDGVRRAAASIADEAADGTVGFLLLTPLSGRDLFLGKYASVMIAALPMGLALVPVFAVSLLVGGVTGTQIARAAVALAHGFSIAAGVGVMISATNRSAGTAMAGTLFAIGAGAFVGGFFAFNNLTALNPMTPLLGIWDAKMGWGEIILAMALWQVLVALALRAQGRKFPDRWRAEEEKAPTATSAFAVVESEGEFWRKDAEFADATARGPKWSGGEPVEWLTLGETGVPAAPKVFAGMAVVCGAIALLTPFGVFYTALLAFVMSIFLCVAAARPFAVARRSHWLELIVTTPVGFEGVIEGHLRALRRIFLWPAVILFGTGLCLLARETAESGDLPPIYYGYPMLGGILLFVAAPWIGMWMGLKMKSPIRAVLATMALVYVAPRIGVCALDAPYFLVMGLLARRGVKRNLQKIVSEGIRRRN